MGRRRREQRANTNEVPGWRKQEEEKQDKKERKEKKDGRKAGEIRCMFVVTPQGYRDHSGSRSQGTKPSRIEPRWEEGTIEREEKEGREGEEKEKREEKEEEEEKEKEEKEKEKEKREEGEQGRRKEKLTAP